MPVKGHQPLEPGTAQVAVESLSVALRFQDPTLAEVSTKRTLVHKVFLALGALPGILALIKVISLSFADNRALTSLIVDATHSLIVG